MSLLKKALYAQLAWFALATTYNGLSLFSIARSGVGFAGDKAATLSALAAVVAFISVTVAGLKGCVTPYRILAPIVTVLLCVGGVLKHLFAGPADYASYHAWVLAILINVFGVAGYAVGSVAAFKMRVAASSTQ